MEHRREIKAPLTQRAAELSVKTLAKLKAQGNNPVEVIEQSVLSGKWTALYPVKDRHGGPGAAGNKHTNFDGKNYGEGIGDDGRF